MQITRAVGSGGSQNLADRVGSGTEVVELSRVGWGRVRRYADLTGRVGSDLPDPREAI